ncbi:MAG: UDP-glucose/GDP-mannose dehydrogenase family protein [Solibacillus sp.]
MNLAVIGTGYVGLVTGVTLAEIGHSVVCVDIDEQKISHLQQGQVPIFEPGLAELMQKNVQAGRLAFTASMEEGMQQADVIYIAVGTPEREDGSADLRAVKAVAKEIAELAVRDALVVVKSTVPVGTNDELQQILDNYKLAGVTLEVASNPEFLREGSALEDAFGGDRIIIGAQNERAVQLLTAINAAFQIPIWTTDVRSAEMIKYASNAFLATKISFINEMATICERIDVDVEQVAIGMGLDTRIGPAFLKAGIGYGGSCFPKDTKALMKIAGNVAYDFELLNSVIHVNNRQQEKLVSIVRERLSDMRGKKIAVLGVAFKPNTDDVRESPAIPIVNALLAFGVDITLYDPVATNQARSIWGNTVHYTNRLQEALVNAQVAMIVTEWDSIKYMDLSLFELMQEPIIVDGRNCFSLSEMEARQYEYYSIGRKVIKPAPIMIEGR